MEKIITDIKKELEKQRLSESKLAEMAGVHQKTVNRLLRGDTKRLDIGLIKKLQDALGMSEQPMTIAEQIGEGYGPEVKLVADYLDVKTKGKTREEILEMVEDIMADIRAKYK